MTQKELELEAKELISLTGGNWEDTETSARRVAEFAVRHYKKQKLEFAIEQLKRFRESTFGKGVNVIQELEQKLKELQYEKSYSFSEDDLCDFVEWMNLHYRALEHTISFKGVEGTKELLKLWKEQKPKIVWYE